MLKLPTKTANDESDITCNLEEKCFTLNILPGLPTGTKIIFPGEGSKAPSKLPGMFYLFYIYFNLFKLLTRWLKMGIIVSLKIPV